MIAQTNHPAPAKSLAPPAQVQITADELIERIRKIASNRFYALTAYPKAISYSEKIQMLAKIFDQLDAAQVAGSTRQKVVMCLKLRSQLLSIAPSATNKLHQTHAQKVNDLMAACNKYLNWRTQS